MQIFTKLQSCIATNNDVVPSFPISYRRKGNKPPKILEGFSKCQTEWLRGKWKINSQKKNTFLKSQVKFGRYSMIFQTRVSQLGVLEPQGVREKFKDYTGVYRLKRLKTLVYNAGTFQLSQFVIAGYNFHITVSLFHLIL